MNCSQPLQEVLKKMCGNAITLLTVLPQTTETSQLLSKFFGIILMNKGAQIPLRKEGRSLHLWRMLVQLSLFSVCIIPRHSRWVGKFADCFICCLTLRWLHRNMWHESLFLLLFCRKGQTSKIQLNPENVKISLVDLNIFHCTYSFISSIFEKLAWSRRFSKESDSWTWDICIRKFQTNPNFLFCHITSHLYTVVNALPFWRPLLMFLNVPWLTYNIHI